MNAFRYLSGFLGGALFAALAYWMLGAFTIVAADRVYIWCGGGR